MSIRNNPSREPADQPDDQGRRITGKVDRSPLWDKLRSTDAVILGTLEPGQSWNDFKAKLKAALIGQGIIQDDGEPIESGDE